MLDGHVPEHPGRHARHRYGSNKVRFINMVPVDSRVRARADSSPSEPKSGGMQMTTEVTIEIDGQTKPACVAETISLVFQ